MAGVLAQHADGPLAGAPGWAAQISMQTPVESLDVCLAGGPAASDFVPHLSAGHLRCTRPRRQGSELLQHSLCGLPCRPGAPASSAAMQANGSALPASTGPAQLPRVPFASSNPMQPSNPVMAQARPSCWGCSCLACLSQGCTPAACATRVGAWHAHAAAAARQLLLHAAGKGCLGTHEAAGPHAKLNRQMTRLSVRQDVLGQHCCTAAQGGCCRAALTAAPAGAAAAIP